jgi:hypothetical protein
LFVRLIQLIDELDASRPLVSVNNRTRQECFTLHSINFHVEHALRLHN